MNENLVKTGIKQRSMKKMKKADVVMWNEIGGLTCNLPVGLDWVKLVVFTL